MPLMLVNSQNRGACIWASVTFLRFLLSFMFNVWAPQLPKRQQGRIRPPGKLESMGRRAAWAVDTTRTHLKVRTDVAELSILAIFLR